MAVLKQKAVIALLVVALAASLIVQWRERATVAPTSLYPVLSGIIAEARQIPGLAAAAIGVCLIDPHGEVFFEDHARIAMIPASSLKTLTTATALEMLGPDFRFETRLRAAAPIVEGTIQGDIVIVGGADPMLAMRDVTAWAQELKARGLMRVAGNVVGDGRVLSGSIFNDFWDWGDIGNGYGSAVAGLNLEHNRYVAIFQPAATVGAPAKFVGVRPEVPDVQWRNEAVTAAAGSGDGVVIHGGERTGLIHLRGSVPLNAPDFSVTGAVPDPARFAAHHFRQALLNTGVQVDGDARAISAAPEEPQDPQADATALITHRSPPLLEIISSIHATSDNHETECLFRLLGVRYNARPDELVREHWRNRGLVFEGLRMEDGCGLARADFIRPVDLARLQHLAARGPHGAAYKDSLLSQNDGRLRWKGGAMSGVRTTTGFVTSTSGREFAFAIMINHYTDADAAGELRDALISAMLRL